MPVYNSEIAAIFTEVANLLDIEGANPFKVRAYRNAARTVETLARPVSELIAQGEDLRDLEGIGEELAAKIKEIVETGHLTYLEEMRTRLPPSITKLLQIEGLGPKRVRKIYEELGVSSLEDLKDAVEKHKIQKLEGIGPKTEQTIREALEQEKDKEARILLSSAEEQVIPLVAYLKKIPGVDQVEVAGSYRRRNQTVGDLDIVVTGKDGGQIMAAFVKYEDVKEIVSQGNTRSTVYLRTGLQVDVRVVEDESYGAALLYFTGSKDHSIHLRKMAVEKELKLNEYGVFREEKKIAGKTEQEIYQLFDLPYIEPELRENRGEIEAARRHQLPKLINLTDLRGDLQMHTTASDGHNTLEEMAQAAKERGYEYIAITDHSKYIGVTNGLDANALAKRIDEIDKLNVKLSGIHILKGIEVEILGDGSLGLPDDILARLDVVLASVHTQFNLPLKKQTARIMKAMDNPHMHILAHPTGRLLGKRPGYQVDLERVMKAALERRCYMEINANPERLDLDDIHAKMAKEMGLKMSISTDAHHASELDYMRFGVGQARRGWLSVEDVLNTRPVKDLLSMLKRY